MLPFSHSQMLFLTLMCFLLHKERDAVNLTCRRICFAVLAVITAFVCIMLQTMPLLHAVSPPNPIFDKLLSELVHVRDFSIHAKECRGLNRDEAEGWRIWKVRHLHHGRPLSVMEVNLTFLFNIHFLLSSFSAGI